MDAERRVSDMYKLQTERHVACCPVWQALRYCGYDALNYHLKSWYLVYDHVYPQTTKRYRYFQQKERVFVGNKVSCEELLYFMV